MTRYVLPAVFLIGLVIVLGVGLRRDPTFVPSPLIGKAAPDFALPRLDDPAQLLRKADLLGDVSIINVWATWCGGCRQEHPLLLQLAKTGGVPFFGVDWKDDTTLARQWLAELGNPYKAVGIDADGKTAIDLGVYGAPETFLLDGQGNVLYKHIAPMTVDAWQREFVPRIASARKAAR